MFGSKKYMLRIGIKQDIKLRRIKKRKRFINFYNKFKVNDIVLTRKSINFGKIKDIEIKGDNFYFTIFEPDEDRVFKIKGTFHQINIRLKKDNRFSLFSKKEWERTYLFGRNSLYGNSCWFDFSNKDILDLYLLRCIKAEIEDNNLETKFKETIKRALYY